MAEQRSDVYAEEYYRIALGQGIYTSDLTTNIPDGYSTSCYNMIATGDSLENRPGIKKPSVDWNTWDFMASSIPPTQTNFNCFAEISPWGGDSSKPAFMWCSGGWQDQAQAVSAGITLNAIRAAGATDANNGFMSVTIPSLCAGICQYSDTVYFLLASGVQKITNFNWATDTITYSPVASAVGLATVGLVSFKDRLWTFGSNKIYYTNVPTVGGLPETWNLATNFEVISSPGGNCGITKLVPLGNKLIIFTTNGLYTLLVEGEPASWIQRVLDSKSICTSFQCAFESKGAVYYVNTEGVWATNGIKTVKLSGTIEDQFFQSTGRRVHNIHHYEDGMIVSIFKSTTNNLYVDNSFCNVFYSKLDPICWTNWDVGNVDKPATNFSLCGFNSTTNKIPTYLNSEPIVYAMAYTTDSTTASPKLGAMQLVVFDGGHDEYRIAASTASEFVQIYLKTKHFDGGNQYNLKQAKRGLIEIYSSDSQHKFTGSWDLDGTISVATEKRARLVQDFTVGNGSNLVQLLADFYYRRASFNLRATLQSDTSQIKIKDLAVVQSLHRSEFEQVR